MSDPLPCVVIDAGHGGHDSGALGPAGTREADINLKVASLLASLLASSARVVLTRRSDIFLDLDSRAAVANSENAALFVSLHCNAADGIARGIETYHFRGSTRGRALALLLQAELTGELPGSRDRGVKPAGFAVLRETEMPAALVEMEFIDTEDGEKLLRSEYIQAALADAIAEGITRALGLERDRLGIFRSSGSRDAAAVAAGPAILAAVPHPPAWRQEFFKFVYRLAEIVALKKL